jgi:integrase
MPIQEIRDPAGRLIAYAVFVAKVGGRSIRKRFGISKFSGNAKAARAAAEAWAKRKAAQVKGARERTASLSESQLVDASNAVTMLRDGGSDISLSQAVDFYLKAQNASATTADPKSSWTFAQAAEALIANRKARGAKPYYIMQLAKQLGAFRKMHGHRKLDEIDLALVERWLDGRKGRGNRAVKPVTRGNYLRDLSMVFAFAVQRGKASANPIRRAENALGDPGESITILTPAECMDILATAQTFADVSRGAEQVRWRQITLYLALRLFTGIRRSELQRMSLSDIHLADREVIVPAAAAKTRHRRPVSISDNLLAWIKFLLAVCTAIEDTNYRRLFSLSDDQEKWRWSLLQQHAGVRIPQNALRHSWFSYHLALHKNPGLTHREGAHANERIMYRHYARLVATDDARAFFSILPACRVLDNVPEFRNRRTKG